MKSLFRVALIVGFLAISHHATWAQNDHAADIEQLKAYRFGASDAALNVVAHWVSEVRPDEARRREAAKSLAGVLTSDASFDAKQFVCRQLVLIGGDDEIPALIGLLKDESLAHYAALALARISGTAANENLRRELPQSTGKARLEIIGVLGERRDANAIDLLAAFLKSDDQSLMSASANALGKIGNTRGAALLRAAYQNANGPHRLVLGRALLECADALRAAGDADSAVAIYETLHGDTTLPMVSAGALRGIALVRGEKSLPFLLEALGRDNTPQQKTAAALSREIKGEGITKRLCEKLPQLTPDGQLLLVSALGARGDSAAAPAVATLLGSEDAAVRIAAADAIGSIGDASTVPMLLNIATGNAKEQRDAARASLTRLSGQTVDAKLLTLLDKASAPQKVEIIGALQSRRVMAAIPRLLPEANSVQPEVRRATLLLLRDMAEPSATTALLDLLPVTAPEQRGALLDTIAEIARRGTDDAQRTAPILAKLTANKKPSDKVELLALLGRVGGNNALETLRKSTQDTVPDIRLAALRALSAWPTDEPLNDLLRVAKNAPDEKSRLIALRGFVRLAGLSETRSPAATLELYRQASALDQSADGTKALIAGLSKLKSVESLDYASSFLKNETVRAEAELAVVEIARGTLGAWREKSRAAIEPIAKNSTNENARQNAQAILDLSDKLGDFVTAWEVSPAYEQAGATCEQLFDIAFAPEDPKQAVVWHVMPVATSAEQPWLLDLLALHGGLNRVAYLRTAVWSDKERELVLETGSDDGTKAWWNGAVVLSKNVQRAVEPGQDKTKIIAKAGWNDLMLKITQNNQGWGSVARFTNSDSSPATSLRFALPTSRPQ